MLSADTENVSVYKNLTKTKNDFPMRVQNREIEKQKTLGGLFYEEETRSSYHGSNNGS